MHVAIGQALFHLAVLVALSLLDYDMCRLNASELDMTSYTAQSPIRRLGGRMAKPEIDTAFRVVLCDPSDGMFGCFGVSGMKRKHT